jgi:hypothetical protein
MSNLLAWRERNVATSNLVVERDHFDPVAFLRRDHAGGDYVCTSRGDSVHRREFERIYTFARRARGANEARSKRMRGAYGTKLVSATHRGDVRHGCTLVSWEELNRMAEILGLA